MVSTTPLDDVEFLARSTHRVRVLQLLFEGPHSRADLHEETGISQPTLGRVLGSLRDRNWVEEEGREYALTAFGELVAEEFVSLLDTVETVQNIGDVVGLLRTDVMDFDVRRFGDATVTTPATGDPFRHVRRVEELVYGADHLRLLSNTVAPGTFEDYAQQYEEFLANGQAVESVISADTLDQALADPRVREMFREFLALDRVRLYRYEGNIPQMTGVADGVVFLVPTDGQDLPTALIETTDDTIRAWAEATIDEYIEASTELTAEDI